jgi:hypothetical protein
LRGLINKFNRQNKKGAPLHRRASRKKGKKIRRSEDALAASVGEELKAKWDISQFKVPPAEGKTRFHDFDLSNPLLHAISELKSYPAVCPARMPAAGPRQERVKRLHS